MSTYTPEDVELAIARMYVAGPDDLERERMPRAYAATLRQAARVDEVMVRSVIQALENNADDCERNNLPQLALHLRNCRATLEAALSAQPATVRCEPCGGMGNIMDMRCIGCDGTGRVSAQPAQGERPKHGSTHEDCGGQWCDYVQPEYKPSAARSFSPGESSIARYVRIGMICDKCGKEHPAAPVGVPDGWKLAMWVLQSDLYRKLPEEERAVCDALVAENPYIAAAPSAPQGVE